MACPTASVMLKPRAVIFDFGGVLCFHPTEERFDRIARMFGLSTLELLEVFWAHRIDYDAGKLDSRAYWRYVTEAAGASLDEAQLPALIQQEVELWNNFDPHILGWAAHLQASGVRTAILSNLPRSIGEALRIAPGFLDPFDHLTFSYELGVVKPDAAIYHHALRGVGVEPGEALFLDDRPENIEGARQVGLLAEQYSTWENFVRDGLSRYELPRPTATIADRSTGPKDETFP
jgi:putative hydrolase of the HAD superfamily